MEFKAIIKDRLRYRRRRYNATDESALEDTLLSKNIAVVELNQCQKRPQIPPRRQEIPPTIFCEVTHMLCHRHAHIRLLGVM